MEWEQAELCPSLVFISELPYAEDYECNPKSY